MRRPVFSLLLCAALASATLVAGPVPAANAETTSVTLVGSLQSELGCAADWAPDCADSHLVQLGTSDTWEAAFDLPAGSYEYKVALNDTWDVDYGAGGVLKGPNIPLNLVGPASVVFSFDAVSHITTVRPATLPTGTTPADRWLATNSLRQPLTGERYYFVMADRFANGDPSNDRGGLTGSRLATGYDPTDNGFYHGGDLKGLIGKLDYIKNLGTTAIWLTPAFKNRPVQGTPGNESAGYHGYWITDFTQIDPHLGTNADMQRLISSAHAKGMKVFFDIITNHTADIIDYSEKTYSYVSTADKPYKTATGQVFDPKEVAGTDDFPALDVDTSFPYHPVFNTPADATVKVPAWLNDRTLYHNRGDSTFAGESSEYGDFVGLDDLFTENPKVVDGMIDVYKAWVDLGIDGFRIDTVKHVNTEFWQKFSPAIQAEANRVGNRDFFMFAEVYDARPDYLSTFTTTAKLPATLDFGFQAQAQAFAQGKPTTNLRDLFVADDYYTDTDSNAYQLPTFLGNHDMGRLSYLLDASSSSNADLLRRVKLANALMYLTRGQPIVYYGDEQGFIGSGGDKAARQDMFATQTPSYASEEVLGGTSGSRDRFDANAVLYRFIRKLAALRAANPGLTAGAQIHRYASSGAGVYAFSRVDRRSGIEYVVALNNADSTKTASFVTFNANERFQPLYGADRSLRSNAEGRVSVRVPAMSAVVYKARTKVDRGHHPPAVTMTVPQQGGILADRAEIGATLSTSTFAQASFFSRAVGTSKWQPLGTDDSAPYRVFHDVSGYPDGTLLEYRTVVRDAAGRISADATYGVTGKPVPSGGNDGNVGAITQPDKLTVPGDHNSEMGCGGDWDPACTQAQLTYDPADQIWKATYDNLPAGNYAFKAAINGSWDENYGEAGVPNGSNISYTNPGTVRFFYDHRTHYATTDTHGPLITAPGTWNTALGCATDKAPACMRPWLQDPEGDSTYTWATSLLPAGDYTFKIAEDFATDEGSWYPQGANSDVAVTVPADGLVVRVTYNRTTHQVSTTVTRPNTAPALTPDRGVWVAPDLIAWPADALGDLEPRLAEFRLYWGADGALAVDAEAITGGRSVRLSLDPAGLPAAVVQADPGLTGYLALRVDRSTVRQLPRITSGDVAVGVFSGTRLVDAGLVNTAGVG